MIKLRKIIARHKMPKNYGIMIPFTEETLYDAITELCGDKQYVKHIVNGLIDKGPVDPPEYHVISNQYDLSDGKIPYHNYEWELVVYAQ